jgi:hypothetical protein
MKNGLFPLVQATRFHHWQKATKGVKQFSLFFVFLRESFVFGGRGRSDAHTTFLGMAINKTMRRRRHLENKSKMDDRVWFVFPRSQSLGNRQQGQKRQMPCTCCRHLSLVETRNKKNQTELPPLEKMQRRRGPFASRFFIFFLLAPFWSHR